MRYQQLIRITGVANNITYDDGLKSTEAEPKRLVEIQAQMDSYAATDDNDVQGWHERAKVFDIPEKLLPSEAAADTASDAPEPRCKTIPVDLDIPIGETFKLAIKCAATAKNVRGVYVYEILS